MISLRNQFDSNDECERTRRTLRHLRPRLLGEHHPAHKRSGTFDDTEEDRTCHGSSKGALDTIYGGLSNIGRVKVDLQERAAAAQERDRLEGRAGRREVQPRGSR